MIRVVTNRSVRETDWARLLKPPRQQPGAGEGEAVHKGQTPTAGPFQQGKTDPSGRGTAGDIKDGESKGSEHKESGSMGGSYTKDRALAKQNALARQLKSSLKGEIVPSPEQDDSGEAETTNGDTDNNLGDEEYRGGRRAV